MIFDLNEVVQWKGINLKVVGEGEGTIFANSLDEAQSTRVCDVPAAFSHLDQDGNPIPPSVEEDLLTGLAPTGE
jgi:hypothetical protein